MLGLCVPTLAGIEVVVLKVELEGAAGHPPTGEDCGLSTGHRYQQYQQYQYLLVLPVSIVATRSSTAVLVGTKTLVELILQSMQRALALDYTSTVLLSAP